MQEWDFQKEARQHLRQNASILLVAPTGMGKTRACLKPFVDAVPEGGLLGTRLIYALPLRALVDGVVEEFQNLADEVSESWTPAVHYGGRPESQVFSEPACVTTIDQYLTAFAGAPLSSDNSGKHKKALISSG